MSGNVAMESELNGIITEYLDFYGFEATIRQFNDECNLKGKSISGSDTKSGSQQKINFLMNEMIHLFNQGERKEFFRYWIENIPTELISSKYEAQRLEMELYIHFAVYQFKKSGLPKEVMRAQSREGMNAFKSYIESKGHIVSQMKEFLPYFGIPYADNPAETFPEIFSEAWLADVRERLVNFLKNSLNTQSHPPRLSDLYSLQMDNNSTAQELGQRVIEAEKKASMFFKKFNKSQADYHVLIGITAELVDSLENAISGKTVAPEYLSNIISRLFNTQMKQSLDFTRPGTAGDYIRQSVAYQKNNLERAQTASINQLPLDFVKIKHDMLHQKERHQLLLLQSLRWRLTRAESGEHRQKYLNSYIVGDLLNCRSEKMPNELINLVKTTPSDNVRQYFARLINTLASLNHGRSYLASNQDLIKNMHYVLRNEKEDTITKQNLLAALQKLSLRRNLQTIMINDNVLEWLVTLLENNEELSDYSLEYASALFMNLSLRSAGKKRLVNDYKNTLKVISELLGNSNTEIRPFINGTLYSILTIPSLRKQAKLMNFEAILEGYLAEGTEEMRRQIEFLIKQINSTEEHEDPESDIEDGDDDEEDDPIIMEANLDRSEIVTKQLNNELIGENLLQGEYSINNEQKLKPKSGLRNLNESVVLDRPMTPSYLRQSHLLQTKPFSLNELNNFIPNTSTNSNMWKKNVNKNIDKRNSLKLGIPGTENLESNEAKTSTNILVINSQDDLTEEDNYQNPSSQTKPFKKNDPTTGFSSRPKIQRTPDQSINLKKNYDSINTASFQSGSSVNLAPKFSINEPRPSSANSFKTPKSPIESTASTLK